MKLAEETDYTTEEVRKTLALFRGAGFTEVEAVLFVEVMASSGNVRRGTLTHAAKGFLDSMGTEPCA